MFRKIGILCAGDTELEPFLKALQNPIVTRAAMLTCYEGALSGMNVAALYSGVCKVNAAIAAQILIDRFGADAVINAGTAGGISAEVGLFDTVVTERSAYHDVDGGILTEFHPWLKEPYFESDKTLVSLLKRCAETLPGTGITFGTTVTGEQFITAEKRMEITEKYGPLSTDMETAAVAHVCYANGVPFAAVRTITDTAEHSGIDVFEANCKKASEIAASVVIRLLEELNAPLHSSGFAVQP